MPFFRLANGTVTEANEAPVTLTNPVYTHVKSDGTRQEVTRVQMLRLLEMDEKVTVKHRGQIQAALISETVYRDIKNKMINSALAVADTKGT